MAFSIKELTDDLEDGSEDMMESLDEAVTNVSELKPKDISKSENPFDAGVDEK